jgi:uncharacterized protein (TIGR03083 family)
MTTAYPYALPFGRYREHMATDYARLLELAKAAETGQGLADAVPACPEWDTAKLLRHTALVYLQKALTIETGSKPQGKWAPEEIRQLDPVAMLERCYAELTAQFDSHQPTDPAESWVPEDQTVGFWIRRLAHETAIHRYDMETVTGATTPIDPELAVDGINEVLTVMLVGRGNNAEEPANNADPATGQTVLLESGGKAWSVTLRPTGVDISRESVTEPAARIIGNPSDVLLWMWGREPLPAAMDSRETSNPAVTELRLRLAATT